MRNVAGLPQGTGKSKPVRVIGGGFVTSVSISTDGVTMTCGVDVFGGYVKSTGDTVWRDAWNATSLAVGDCPNTTGYVAPANGLVDTGNGCFALVVAPNDNQRLYGVWNARTWKSTNAGKNWTHLTGVPDIQAYTNSGPQPHNCGPNIAADPQNHDVFLLGTQANGLYATTDGGSTFTHITLGTNATINSYQWPHKVACDPTGSVVSTVKQRWFAVLQGTGVYVSTTGPGGTYTLMTGSPTNVSDIVFDASGNCWALDPTNAATSNLWKCAAGGTTWAHNPTSAPYLSSYGVTIACDPRTSGASGRIVILSDGGIAAVSSDGGATWLGGGPFGPALNKAYAYTAPWLAGTVGTPGMARFNPAVANDLWTSAGVGVYHCQAPTTNDGATATGFFRWQEQTEGIENMVANVAVEAPGGSPLIGFWDQGAWQMADLDHSWRGFNYRVPPGAFASAVEHCWDIAYAADNPLWVAALINNAGQWSMYSADGLSTTQGFPTVPPNNGNGGCIAVGNAGNVIIIYSNNGQPVYTKNGGSTWATLPFPNLVANGTENGFGFAYYNSTKYITYHPLDGAFYLYNYGAPSVATSKGLWKSTDQGDTWTRVYTANIVGASDGYRSKLKAVRDHAGHLFFCDGAASTGNLMRSTNGGATWTAVTGVTSVVDYAFGAAAPGQSYPAVYFYGIVAAVSPFQGLYRSDDNFATAPKLLTFFPGNRVDYVSCIGASSNKYGRVYVGFGGSSFVYLDYDCPITVS